MSGVGDLVLCPVCEERELDSLIGETVCPGCLGRLRGMLRGIGSTVEQAPLVVVPGARGGGAPSTRRAVDGGRIVPGLASALEAAVRGALRFGSPGPVVRSTDARLPLVPEAVRARDELLRVLDGQARSIAVVRGVRPPARALVPAAGFLLTQLAWLRTRDDAPARVAAVIDAVRVARRAVEHPSANQAFFGWCTGPLDDAGGCCGKALYAAADVEQVECRWCGAQYDAPLARSTLLAEARPQLLTSAQAALALHALGMSTASARTVTRWARHGLVSRAGSVPTGQAHEGRSLFRLDEIWRCAARLGYVAPPPKQKRATRRPVAAVPHA